MLIATDVDGTLYDGEGVPDEAISALARARDDGHVVLIVTGRRWESLAAVVPDVVELCIGAVCEEGGVFVDVATRSLRLLAEPVELELVEALELAGVPALDIGHVVIGAPVACLAEVLWARDHVGSRRSVVTNKGSVALVPPGCDKGTGVRAAVAALALGHHSILAIGDAENDLAMFAVATISVGVANADDAVRASGVALTAASFGMGVAEAVRRHVPGRAGA
jgi:hydroxymethylpyrimidine pyrophosphatase-like HAD family hydrolase